MDHRVLDDCCRPAQGNDSPDDTSPIARRSLLRCRQSHQLARRPLQDEPDYPRVSLTTRSHQDDQPPSSVNPRLCDSASPVRARWSQATACWQHAAQGVTGTLRSTRVPPIDQPVRSFDQRSACRPTAPGIAPMTYSRLSLFLARAIGAAVARFVHTEEVTGSNPVSPTQITCPGPHSHRSPANGRRSGMPMVIRTSVGPAGRAPNPPATPGINIPRVLGQSGNEPIPADSPGTPMSARWLPTESTLGSKSPAIRCVPMDHWCPSPRDDP